jgi:hypothetical protein
MAIAVVLKNFRKVPPPGRSPFQIAGGARRAASDQVNPALLLDRRQERENHTGIRKSIKFTA